jgi:hypothetical protein
VGSPARKRNGVPIVITLAHHRRILAREMTRPNTSSAPAHETHRLAVALVQLRQAPRHTGDEAWRTQLVPAKLPAVGCEPMRVEKPAHWLGHRVIGRKWWQDHDRLSMTARAPGQRGQRHQERAELHHGTRFCEKQLEWRLRNSTHNPNAT